MAFVRTKKVKPKDSYKTYTYYQVVRNYRERGKHRQEVIRHLGKHPTVGAAIEALRQKEDEIRAKEAYWRSLANSSKAELFQSYYEELGRQIPEFEYAQTKYEEAWEQYNEASQRDWEDYQALGALNALIDLWSDVMNLWSDVMRYNKLLGKALWYEEWADEWADEIDELREVQRTYFVR
jgi:hypothetical protein